MRGIRPALSIVVTTLMLSSASPALAHGGGMDDRGCHRDTQAGNYHCHSGPHDGRTFDSKADYPTGSGGATASQGRGDPTTSRRSSGSQQRTPYDRDDYHSRWLDRDNDCQDTREEVLIRQSREPVEFETADKCNVVTGRWRDPYSGETFTDPGNLHIDHVVPLSEAHRSGAWRWPQDRKHTYANDLDTTRALIAVEAGQNMSKSDRDPSDWMPANEAYHCDYLRRWVSIKRRWDLTMDESERGFIQNRLSRCPGNQ